jgi:hypothetical protein
MPASLVDWNTCPLSAGWFDHKSQGVPIRPTAFNQLFKLRFKSFLDFRRVKDKLQI